MKSLSKNKLKQQERKCKNANAESNKRGRVAVPGQAAEQVH